MWNISRYVTIGMSLTTQWIFFIFLINEKIRVQRYWVVCARFCHSWPNRNYSQSYPQNIVSSLGHMNSRWICRVPWKKRVETRKLWVRSALISSFKVCSCMKGHVSNKYGFSLFTRRAGSPDSISKWRKGRKAAYVKDTVSGTGWPSRVLDI